MRGEKAILLHALRNTEWTMTGGVNDANNMLWRRVNEVAEDKIGKTIQGTRRRTCNRWWNRDIEKARKNRQECNRVCRRLRRKRDNSETDRQECEDAWEKYRSAQKEVKKLIRKAQATTER